MRPTALRLSVLASGVAVLAAAPIVVPYYLRLRAYYRGNPPSPPFANAGAENAVVTVLSLASAAFIGAVVSLLLRFIRPLWAKVLGALPILFLALVFGSLPVYAYVYRGAPPGMHLNIPHLYRFAPLAAATASVLITLFLLHPPRLLRPRQTNHREA